MPLDKFASFVKRRLPFFRPDREQPRPLDIAWMVEAYAARLRKYRSGYVAQGPNRVGNRVAVLVTPWQLTPVPMYSMETALGLARAGEAVTVIWDPTDLMGNAARRSESHAVASLLGKLPRLVDVVQVKGDPVAPPHDYPAADLAWAESILHENGIAFLRQEKGVCDFVQKHRDCIPRIAAHLAKVIEVLAAGRYDWVHIPGGIYGLSALYVEACKRLGISSNTYDTGYAVLIAKDGVATHQTDIPLAYDLLTKDVAFDDAARARVIEYARDELATRMQGKGYSSQVVAAGQGSLPPCDILVPLNLRWDSAALWRMKLFPTVEAWIRAIGAWAQVHPEATVCFRQHPCERDPIARGLDDIPALLHEIDPAGRQLSFVRAEDLVNTYDLIEASRVVLPFTSTVGIEAAMLGKPIILHTQCYYEGFSFASAPPTTEEYFACLTTCWQKPRVLDRPQREEAAIAYYLAQICLYLYTTFSAPNLDYQKWVEVEPAELWAVPENEDLLIALTKRLPVAYVRHLRKFQTSI